MENAFDLQSPMIEMQFAVGRSSFTIRDALKELKEPGFVPSCMRAIVFVRSIFSKVNILSRDDVKLLSLRT